MDRALLTAVLCRSGLVQAKDAEGKYRAEEKRKGGWNALRHYIGF
jgi:hypothetical protein